MTHLFLNKELSSIAKEKGFDEPCFAYYRKSGTLNTVDISMDRRKYHDDTEAPLYQQIIDWFFKVHQIDIVVKVGITLNWSGYITINKGNVQQCPLVISHCHTKQDALNFLLKEAFKLIKL